MSLRICTIVIAMVMIIAGLGVNCYSEDVSNVNRTMTMQGNVTAVDWVGSTIVVNDMEFTVPSNVDVRKGIDKVSFQDIDVGDSVTVTYGNEEDGSFKVIRIIVAYSGELPV